MDREISLQRIEKDQAILPYTFIVAIKSRISSFAFFSARYGYFVEVHLQIVACFRVLLFESILNYSASTSNNTIIASLVKHF